MRYPGGFKPLHSIAAQVLHLIGQWMIRHDETGAITIVPITFLATCKDCEANVGMMGEWCMLLHVRGSSFEWHKPLSGMQTKPDDTWTVPLCSACHRKQLENPHAKSQIGTRPNAFARPTRRKANIRREYAL